MSKPNDRVIAIREANQKERRAESEARIAKDEGITYVSTTLTETFKALKPLAALTDTDAFADNKIGATLLRFWQNAG